jgi:hypothetical protein
MDNDKRDIRTIVRSYEQDGKIKHIYQTIGTAWISEHASKITLQIETLPVNKDWTGKCWADKPYEKKTSDLDNLNEFDNDINTIKAIGDVKRDVLPSDEEMDKPIDLTDVIIPF